MPSGADNLLNPDRRFQNLQMDDFLKARIPFQSPERKLASVPKPCAGEGNKRNDGNKNAGFVPNHGPSNNLNSAPEATGTGRAVHQGHQEDVVRMTPLEHQPSKWARRASDIAVSDSRQCVNGIQQPHQPSQDSADSGGEHAMPNGFQTARVGYMKMAQKDPSKKNLNEMKAGKRTSGQGSGKFIPPYMKKALNTMNDDANKRKGGQQDKKVGKNEDDSENGPISLRTYDLLRLSPGDPLPEELSKIDPFMIEQVCNEVIDSGASVAWEDIAGQDAAKRLIQEVVVWPMMNPEIFKVFDFAVCTVKVHVPYSDSACMLQGARAPPKGILLFGPPGTGKTLLGKAIASNIDASFFAISASSLTSKWIGDGEKMVKALFAVAGWMAPSVIFIDEIDSLLSARKSEGEHESSRRLKTEILVQMEGCDPASASRKVLLVGATNRPEELDEAARRRMPKQMYIPLPCQQARKEMILRVLGSSGSISASLSEPDVEKIVQKTQGYSGSDMKNLIQEACQGPIREAVRSAGAKVASLQETDLRPVTLRDFAIAAKAQRASTEPSEIVRYEDYNEKHGAKIIGDPEDEDIEGW